MDCYRRYDNGAYLLTCLLPKGHAGDHVCDDEKWAPEAGWSDAYTGAPIYVETKRETNSVEESVVVPVDSVVPTIEPRNETTGT
jgi:hypothetical protein